MGWAERLNPIGRNTLLGLKVAVDVQHLYKPDHPDDRGSLYTMADGTHVTEAHCTTIYAQSLCAWLIARGASVLTNDPLHSILIGYYTARGRGALAWGSHAYLACHLNAGRGSYAAIEAMNASPGIKLGPWIEKELVGFPEILASKTIALAMGDRGSVCIRAALPPCAAVIVEPFFGDNPAQQSLMTTERLGAVGEAIAAGVGNWWLALRAATP